MKNNNQNPKEQGQSLVELALSLVLLLTLLAGLIDFGRAFFTYVALRDAAQEGAAYASVSHADALANNDVTSYCQAITNRALATTSAIGGNSSGPIDLQRLASLGEVAIQTQINGTECTAVAAADICMGGAVSVQITYDNFTLTTPLLGTILGSQNLTLDAVVVDSILTPACQ